MAEAQGQRKAGETIKEVLLGKLLDDLPDCMLDAVTRLTRNSYDQEVERGWRGATQAQQDRHAHKRRGQAAFTAALLLRQRDMHAMPRLALAMGIDRILSTGTYREHDIMCMLRIMPSEAYIRKELEALGRDWRGPSLKDDGEEPSKLYEVRCHIYILTGKIHACVSCTPLSPWVGGCALIGTSPISCLSPTHLHRCGFNVWLDRGCGEGQGTNRIRGGPGGMFVG